MMGVDVTITADVIEQFAKSDLSELLPNPQTFFMPLDAELLARYAAPPIQPLHDRVLVRLIPEESKSLLIIPDIAKSKSILGEVVAVGPGKRRNNGSRQPMNVKPGDRVRFNSKWNDWESLPDELHLIQEGDIFGIIESN
jgi:chaperonin GroES